MDEIVGFDVESDDLVGARGGFLAIRRLRLRNRRKDGSLSDLYLCDFIARPYGLDAVVVALYHRTDRCDSGIEVLLRRGLRPPLAFGRTADKLPVAGERSYMYLTELVAGIVEEGDRGMDGIRHRAAEEALEEAGFRIDPAAVTMLGAALFPSPGAMAEKFWLTAVEIADPAAQEAIVGDGSPMEEGVSTQWRDLDAAIAACVRGEIEDCKTEVTLRRLRDMLARSE